jgi:chorismate mutase
MAGDWIKMTHALPEKPEVLAIAGRTGMNRFEVVGRLFTLWRWFDINTLDGNALGVTSVTLNECLFGYPNATNFVSAVVDARWLHESAEGVSVVNFDEHISESAKTRAQTAKRVAKSKANAKSNAEGNGVSVTSSVTKTVPREEKRREEKKKDSEPVGFAEFWQEYPNHTAKANALKAWGKVPAELHPVIMAAVAVQRISAAWTKDNGQFVPHAATWLNGKRWEDDSASPVAKQESFV